MLSSKLMVHEKLSHQRRQDSNPRPLPRPRLLVFQAPKFHKSQEPGRFWKLKIENLPNPRNLLTIFLPDSIINDDGASEPEGRVRIGPLVDAPPAPLLEPIRLFEPIEMSHFPRTQRVVAGEVPSTSVNGFDKLKYEFFCIFFVLFVVIVFKNLCIIESVSHT